MEGTVGKTLGLKPRVVHWIYTMVIRTIWTYSSTVWSVTMSAGHSSVSYRD